MSKLMLLMLTMSYSSLGLAYKYLLTSSITQVACKSFSLLNYTTGRLKSSLVLSKQESFKLMSSVKSLLILLLKKYRTNQR